ELAISGGDDYELLFTVSAELANNISEIGLKSNVNCSIIGQVTKGNDIIIVKDGIVQETIAKRGYNHFNT
ncbi:MAG: thiamine-phosphate kinase, partial [Alphaproteobacteria bacterium]|nr:thiamine-phosphate kinase [Alphaproteobacteria bacterium]